MDLNRVLIVGDFQYDGKKYFVLGGADYDYEIKAWFAWYDGVFDPETSERVSTEDKARFLKEEPFYESMQLLAYKAFRKSVKKYVDGVVNKSKE